ncbi:DUF4292 domain-containing protein [Pontibacter vulgaris]|uniref:DUF4292 domain-containing protein n=1 Tax=Pontibacter vulgaris TaxID=2905679 RepID=UPI001FA73BC2|nr:DUF4292 domain-containing protein [Pontibacter vulgaris]
MNKQLLLCLLAFTMLTACKKETVPTTASSTTETIGKVTVQNLDFNYLSAKGSLTLDDRGESTTSGYSMRIKKDSVIWVSVQPGLGIEAARLKITQDSVFVMNRLRREFTATSYTYLSNKLKVDVNFDVLQAILLGNYQPNGQEKSIDEAGQQHVQQLRENLLFDYFIGKQNQKLQQLNVKDQQTGSTITVKYNTFQPIGDVPFAHALVAQVQQPDQISSFNLMHSRVTVTDEILDFPFAVPSDYKRL